MGCQALLQGISQTHGSNPTALKADSLPSASPVRVMWLNCSASYSTCARVLSCVRLFETPCTMAHQAPPLSMEFSRQEYWNGLLFPSPGYLPDPGIKPMSLHLLHWQVDSLPLCHLGSHDGIDRLLLNTPFLASKRRLENFQSCRESCPPELKLSKKIREREDTYLLVQWPRLHAPKCRDPS